EEFYDNNLYPLYGMALFLVIYTIAYSVFQMLVEKKSGIWDRIILSPAKKWEMYTANFIYSSIVGYLQISIIFLLFRFVFDVDFGGKLDILLVAVIPYVLTIVSLIILIVGIVKTVQQFNVAIPIVSLSMAMLGGAFGHWKLLIQTSCYYSLTLFRLNMALIYLMVSQAPVIRGKICYSVRQYCCLCVSGFQESVVICMKHGLICK